MLGKVARLFLAAYPFLLAAAFVLERFAGASATPQDLWRPMVIGQALTGLLVVILWLAVRSRNVAALGTSALLAALANYTFPAVVMIALLLWWALLRRTRREGGKGDGSPMPCRLAAGYSVALLAAALISAGWSLWPRMSDRDPLPIEVIASSRPNIHVLLLDGYPRADTLEGEFGIDNTAFLTELDGLGFDVASEAVSNYNKTWLTVAGLLDARYVHVLPELVAYPDEPTAQMRLLHEAIDRGAVLTALRDLGYEVVSIPSPVTTTDIVSDADVRSAGHLTAFEVSLLSHSLLGRVLPDLLLRALTSDQRENLVDQLDLMRRSGSERSSSPRFVMTHLMSPHLPFLLGQDPEYLTACFPHCDFWTTPLEKLPIDESEFARRLQVQVRVLNGLVVDALRDLVEADPSAIILVLSDHGIRHHVANTTEHFHSFFAARTPGFSSVFPADISTVNVFRRVFTQVFQTALPDLPYQAWRSDWDAPLILSRFE